MHIVKLFFWAGIAIASTLHRLPSDGVVNFIPLTTTGNVSVGQQPNFTFDELYSLQKQFLDHFISPANAKEVRTSSASRN